MCRVGNVTEPRQLPPFDGSKELFLRTHQGGDCAVDKVVRLLLCVRDSERLLKHFDSSLDPSFRLGEPSPRLAAVWHDGYN